MCSIRNQFRGSDLRDLEEATASRVQDVCSAISAAKVLYFSLQNTASMGRGNATSRKILEGTDVCYYGGFICKRQHAARSKHLMDLGVFLCNHQLTFIILDI